MSAMTMAVAVDAVARFELPLLAGIIGYLPRGSLLIVAGPLWSQVVPSRERIRCSTHARSTPDDLENPKARSASEAAIALRQTMQVQRTCRATCCGAKGGGGRLRGPPPIEVPHPGRRDEASRNVTRSGRPVGAVFR
jgi:hypothetical protein